MKKSIVLLWDDTEKTLNKFKKWLPKVEIKTERKAGELCQQLIVDNKVLQVGEEMLVSDDGEMRKIKRNKNCKGMM